MNSKNHDFQKQLLIFGRKSISAISLIALLPILAIYSLFYFGIHGFSSRFSSQKKSLLLNLPTGNFKPETVSAS